MKKLLLPLSLVAIISSIDARDAKKKPSDFDVPVIHLTQRIEIIKKFVPENPVMLEAGSFDGRDAVEMLHVWPHATIHCFEPVAELYKKVVATTANYEQIKTYRLALGDKIDKVDIYISEFPNERNRATQSCSVLRPKEHITQAPGILFPRKEKVKMTTIDQWAAKNNIDHIDVLWLDMQGYELNALMHASTILPTVKAICIELEFVEAYEGQYQYEEVRAWLEQQGFTFIAVELGNDWFGDGIFVRLN